ncbi:aldo/keto reductase [Streptomyces sp. NPDC005498]|uniref:aldo/keto reductase n=1 Tax=Streptomyces sp. NPDC005498 TaxID=3364717 RepID=UPI00369B9267
MGQMQPRPGAWVPVDRPAHLRRQCEMSLHRLGVDRSDLLHLHRVDPDVPFAGRMKSTWRSRERAAWGPNKLGPGPGDHGVATLWDRFAALMSQRPVVDSAEPLGRACRKSVPPSRGLPSPPVCASLMTFSRSENVANPPGRRAMEYLALPPPVSGRSRSSPAGR